MNVQQFFSEAQQIAPWIVEVRRSLHRIPETGFSEWKTQKFIHEQLDALGIAHTGERTWTIGTIHGAHPGPTVALRADIDALPVTEPEDCPFRSEHEGWMHACGHDGHTAVLLGAAKLLMQHREEMHGTVRLLFQPAEETDGGAEPMVAAGAMEGVSRVFGLHMQPYLNVGQIDSRPGMLNAATNAFELIVRGKSGHAARPNEGVDAIVCAAHLITALQTAVSRSASPIKPCVLSIGTINGGTAKNVICDEVRMCGTLRTADPELRTLMLRRIREICDGVAATFGAQIEVVTQEGYAALVNDAQEVDRVFRVARELLGNENVLMNNTPSMGGEDFSYFLEKAPGAFYHLGCATQQPAPALHTREFYIDERCLPIGSALQCGLVFDYLKEAQQ